MNDAIRVGVIGFGLAGRIFHSAVIRVTPGLALAAIVQRSGSAAVEHYPGVRLARSVEEMLADESIRLVVVATPSNTHYELAEQCLHAGRSVVVDKPFTLTSEQATRLIHLARERRLLVSAYQNRRWDGDFNTVQQVLASGRLGRLVSYESHFDRFRPVPRRDVWRESGSPGSGILFDLGPHLIDQALMLFGTPETITASVRSDRYHAQADDAFDLHLGYANLTVWLRSTLTACWAGPRYVLHGTAGSFVKWGLDPQEDQLRAGMGFGDEGFGRESAEAWGTLYREGEEPEKIATLPGNYRGYYENIRDALTGKTPLTVTPEQAWRTTRLIELARRSSIEAETLEVKLDDAP